MRFFELDARRIFEEKCRVHSWRLMFVAGLLGLAACSGIAPLAGHDASRAVSLELDYGNRFDLDVRLEGNPTPAFRLLLPEGITAQGMKPVTHAHTLTGEWTKSNGVWEGSITPHEGVRCTLRLTPRAREVLISLTVQNASTQEYEDVRVDICAGLCRLPKTSEAEWSNRDFIPALIPLNRADQGEYWYRGATPQGLQAWTTDRGWVKMHLQPNHPEPNQDAPYFYELSPSDTSVACAAPSWDGRRFFFQVWATKHSRHQSPFSGNPCMHLRPQVAAKLGPEASATLQGVAGIFVGTRDELSKKIQAFVAEH